MGLLDIFGKKKEGISIDEIRKKVSSLKEPAKIEYLEGILKEGNMKQYTKGLVHGDLGDIYKKKYDWPNVIEHYEKCIKILKSSKEYKRQTKILKSEGYKQDTIDSVVKSILAFGGIGLIFSLFSKPSVISAQNIQLAPPFPNYMVYVFLAMLIGGIGYFLIKKIKK